MTTIGRTKANATERLTGSRTIRLVLLLCLLALGALTAALFASSARAAVSSSWSEPEEIDHANNAQITGAACPSSTFCVAVDDYGDVMTSTGPTGGEAAWQTEAIKQNGGGIGGLDSLSCPSSGLCVATSYDGDIFVSVDPAAAESWTAVETARLPKAPAEGFPGEWRVSCASTSLCVARSGEYVATSTNPTGGDAAWTLTRVTKTGADLMGMSCPSASFCLATDGSGEILASTDPTGGPSAWTATDIDGGAAMWSPTCPTASLCLATDNEGNVLVSTDPTGGASAWHKLEHLAVYSNYNDTFSTLTCPTTGFCLLTENGTGSVFTTTDPTGGTSAWHLTELATDQLTAAACATDGLCVIGHGSVNNSGSGVMVSTNPTGGATAWSDTHFTTQGHNEGTALSCASTTLCVIADNSGNILTSTNPSGGPTAWKAGHLTGEEIGLITSAACPSTRLCVAVSLSGNVLTSTDPTAGATSWKDTSGEYKSVLNLRGLSCPTASFCAAAGEGDVLISTDPTGGLTAWHTDHLEASSVGPSYEGLNDVACPSASLCVAVDTRGDVLTSTEPAATWQSAHVDTATDGFGRQAALTDVTCASMSFCVALDNAGNVLTSTNPAGGGTTWHVATHVNEGYYGRVTCPSEGLCVTTGYNNGGGEYCTAATPISEAGHAWTLITNCGQPGAISCPSAAFCVALDSLGDVQTASLSESSNEGGSEPPPQEGGSSTPPPSGGQAPTPAPVVQPSNTAPSESEHPSAAVISMSQLRAWLVGLSLKPRGKAATTSVILKHGGYSMAFKALEAGSLSVQWFIMPHGAHAAKTSKHKTVLVASGRVRLSGAGRAVIFVKLTPLGKRLLRHAKRLKIEAKESFAPNAGPAVTTKKGAVITGRR